jgi:serine/threonine-protein kinase
MLEALPGSPSPGSTLSVDTPALRFSVGDSLGDRYTIIEEIGAGGMGVVYKAIDRQLGKSVALKLMRTKSVDPSSIARFRRELSLAQQVSHPNVCRLHDLGESKGVLYISMEFVEGQRLDDAIASMGHLSPRQTIALGRQLCAGLAAVHEQGIVHRDLKPSNIMVGRSGHVFIMDFGLATRHSGADRVTSTGAVLGTFAYLSPEQARGAAVDARSDIYALGLILYEMLTGRIPPGDGVTLPLALRDASERCPPPSLHVSEIPPALDAIVMRCLERDVAKRFASVAEVDRALAQIQTTSAATTQRQRPISARLWPQNKRARTMTAASAAVAVVIAAVLGVKLVRSRVTAIDSRPPIVAVLPLANLSGDSRFDSLGVGVADVLITRLASAPNLTVISAGSTLRYQAAQDTNAIARELGASYVVSGSVQAGKGRMRLALKVLRPDSSFVWAGDYENLEEHLLYLQGRIAEGVSGALNLSLTDSERQKLTRMPTTHLGAFSAYAQGKAAFESNRPDDAIRFLEIATTQDPRFALAYTALGQAYWRKFRDTKEAAWTNKATQSVLDALRLDASLPQVRLVLAEIYRGTGRRTEALEEARQALRGQPRSDDAHSLVGQILAEQGDITAAIDELKRAIDLRPEYWAHHFALANVLFNNARYSEAIEPYSRVGELQPDNYRGFQGLGVVYSALGDTARALENFRKANRLSPNSSTYSNMGSLLYWNGDFGGAEQAYREAIALRPADPVLQANLGDALRRQRLPEASRAYRRAIELGHEVLAVNPHDGDLLSFLGHCHARLGDAAKASEYVAKAVTAAPKSPEVQYYAAAVYAANGREKEALAAFEKAIELGYSVAFIERNDDLEPLRKAPGFRKLLEKARQAVPPSSSRER